MGGIGVLFGATGGYIAGFLAAALIYRLAERRFGDGPAASFWGMAAGGGSDHPCPGRVV